jgi:hypothetical protein
MKFILVLILTLLTLPSMAETKEEQRVWFGMFGRKEVAPNYDLWAEFQLRHDETNQTMAQTLNRFGVLRKINEQHEFGFLFAYVQTGLVKEYRPTLQYAYKNKIDINSFSIRNRLEGRDLENTDADSLRFRSLLRFSRPLNPKYELVIWDEPFLNLTRETWSGDRLFERNRAFAGLRINFEKINFEVGYMNQYIPRETQDLSEHILTLYLIF